MKIKWQDITGSKLNAFNKTAKEMFEELGYEQYIDIDYQSEILYSKKTNQGNKYIEFNMQYKNMVFPCYQYQPPYRYELSLEELQAINKQIYELGWNNE